MGPETVKRIGYDPSSFDAFYRDNVEAIQRFLARRLSDPYEVADLTADVFLVAIDAADTYRRDRGTPRAWLFGIAAILAASHRRRNVREKRALRAVQGRRLLNTDDIARIHERIMAATQARVLYEALDRLPKSERAVLELVALDELSSAEAAAVLGIRAATARVRLHRARRALRRQLMEGHSISSLEALS